MKTNSQKETAASLLKVIPAKWAIAIIASLIVYVVLQPRLNQWFGWNLPSVASLTGDEPAKATPKKDADGKPTNFPKNNKSEVTKDDPEIESESTDQPKASNKSSNPPTSTSTPSSKETDSPKSGTVKTGSAKSETAKSEAAKSGTDTKKSTNNTAKSTASSNGSESAKTSTPTAKGKAPQSVEDYLKEVGRNRFESPNGLLYNPGSEEGHRLKHIERHLKDIPDRPGSHGVFEGSMVEFLIAIDDTVTRAKQKGKGTTMKEDDGAVVYEASFDKPIGFLGGEAGKRKRNPKVKKMRVVLRNDAVITAFPF